MTHANFNMIEGFLIERHDNLSSLNSPHGLPQQSHLEKRNQSIFNCYV